MNLVFIESPYAGDIEQNIEYARACMADSLSRGEYPFASHLLYTQPGILDDNIIGQRILGIDAGLAWARLAHKIAVYIDKGISPGMSAAISFHKQNHKMIEYRKLIKILA